MGINIQQAKAIFIEAIGIPSQRERKAYLEKACAEDPEVGRDLDELLEAHEIVKSRDRSDVVRYPPVTPRHVPSTRDIAFPRLRFRGNTKSLDEFVPAEDIDGRYRVIQVLGEGGMGVVGLAQQLEPVRRKVALKVIKPGMDSRRVLSRFETERQTLAVLDHPNIAKVFDGGITLDGRPYFVMEYVKGVPLTNYCDSNRLTIRERLTLFLQVCQAVQHAHQKGIIHRDLTPTNILVAIHDDRPIVKVIDFGLAKALHQPITEYSQFTPHGTAVGTAMYMSPEQSVFNNLDIDTRSDIYSLGVILYELLTGTTPLEKERYQHSSWDDVLRIIREEEPQRPSSNLHWNEEPARIAAQRRTEPIKLKRLLRGELDWIVMKALEKERNRRYDTTNSLARDIQHYLNDEPVSASPRRAWYRYQKFARRHRGTVLAASIVLVSLFTGVVGSIGGMLTARQAAETLRQHAERERLAREVAVESAEMKQGASDFFVDLLPQTDPHEATSLPSIRQANHPMDWQASNDLLLSDWLASSNDGEQFHSQSLRFRDISLRSLLERASAQTDKRFAGQPLQQVELELTLGKAFRALGDYANSEFHFRRAVDLTRTHCGDELSKVWEAEQELGKLWQLFNPQQADAHFQQLLAEFLPQLEELDRLSLRIRMQAGATRQFVGDWEGAAEELRPVLELQEEHIGPADPDTIRTRQVLAWVEMNRRHYATALTLLEEVLTQQRDLLAENHPDLATTLNILGLLRRMMHQDARADTRDNALLEQSQLAYEDALDILAHALGKEHPKYLVTQANLAAVQFVLGDLDEAARNYEDLLPRIEILVQPHDRTRLATWSNFAAVLLSQGNGQRAEEILRQVFEVAEEHYPPDHPDFQRALQNYRQCLLRNGKKVTADTVKMALQR